MEGEQVNCPYWLDIETCQGSFNSLGDILGSTISLAGLRTGH